MSESEEKLSNLTEMNNELGKEKGTDNTEWYTGYIQGNTFTNKEVKYRLHNGRAIFESDIILADTPTGIEHLRQRKVKGIGIKGDRYRWPRGEIPYIIQSDLPNQDRITQAISHWENNTTIRFILRTDSNAKYYTNYVTFNRYVPGPNENPEEVFHCSASIGMTGWPGQPVVISEQCVVGDVIHEIGHAVGLWHEQSRSDRDDYLEIMWDNIQTEPVNMKPNFNQHVTDGDNLGAYDYRSIMHYGAWFFSKNKQPTIRVRRTDLPGGNQNSLGQKNGLSDGDINAVADLYAPFDPTVILNADGRFELFMESYDNRLIYRKKQGPPSVNNGWDSPWSMIGHQYPMPSNVRPTISRTTDGTLELFWTYPGSICLYHSG